MEENKKITLKEFLENNSNLITVLGVFFALTVYFGDIQPVFFAGLLSSVSLTTSLLIWLELWKQFPSKNASGFVIWFENILNVGTLVLVLFWLYTLNKFFGPFFINISTIILLWPISLIIKHTNVFNKIFHTIPNKLRWLRYLIGFLIILIIWLGCFMLSKWVYPSINKSFTELEGDTSFQVYEELL
jgi:hypothetical protein